MGRMHRGGAFSLISLNMRDLQTTPHGYAVRGTRSRFSYIVYIAYMIPLVHCHPEPHQPSSFTLAQHRTVPFNRHGSSHPQASSAGEHRGGAGGSARDTQGDMAQVAKYADALLLRRHPLYQFSYHWL